MAEDLRVYPLGRCELDERHNRLRYPDGVSIRGDGQEYRHPYPVEYEIITHKDGTFRIKDPYQFEPVNQRKAVGERIRQGIDTAATVLAVAGTIATLVGLGIVLHYIGNKP